MRLSIIVPALNEAALVASTLARVRAQAPGAELIVVDGGSTDDTAALAAQHARVLRSARGRALQLNAGAGAAGGEWMLFLHADTVLPGDFLAGVEMAEARGFRAGAFRLRIAGRHPLLPLLAWGANLRTRRRGIALGDQGLFVTRGLFAEMGGFPEQALMEDYEFVLRLRRRGERLFPAPQTVTTSGRRWERGGFWRTWWQMRRIFRAYHRDPAAAEALARGYQPVR